MPRKNTDVAHRRHVEIVAEKLLGFWPTWRIKSELGKELGLSPSYMDDLIAKAKDMIRETVGDFDEQLKDHIARGHALAAKALEAGDLKTATTMFAALSRLGGLERTTTDVNVSGNLVSFHLTPALPGVAPGAAALPEPAKVIEIQPVSADTPGPDATWAPETAQKPAPDGLPDVQGASYLPTPGAPSDPPGAADLPERPAPDPWWGTRED